MAVLWGTHFSWPGTDQEAKALFEAIVHAWGPQCFCMTQDGKVLMRCSRCRQVPEMLQDKKLLGDLVKRRRNRDALLRLEWPES